MSVKNTWRSNSTYAECVDKEISLKLLHFVKLLVTERWEKQILIFLCVKHLQASHQVCQFNDVEEFSPLTKRNLLVRTSRYIGHEF